jgi:hypothetical protein
MAVLAYIDREAPGVAKNKSSRKSADYTSGDKSNPQVSTRAVKGSHTTGRRISYKTSTGRDKASSFRLHATKPNPSQVEAERAAREATTKALEETDSDDAEDETKD